MINATIRRQQEILSSKKYFTRKFCMHFHALDFSLFVVDSVFLLQNKCSSICDSSATIQRWRWQQRGQHSFKSHIFDFILNIAIKVWGGENNAINVHSQRHNVQQNRILCVSVCECVSECMRACTLLKSCKALTSLTTHLYH